MRKIRIPLLLPFAICFLAAGVLGCRFHDVHRLSDEQMDLRLPDIEDGRTTVDELVRRLGEPAARFEGGRIQIFEVKSHIHARRMSYRWVELSRWDGDLSFQRYHLVTVFDEAGVLKEHSLVRVN